MLTGAKLMISVRDADIVEHGDVVLTARLTLHSSIRRGIDRTWRERRIDSRNSSRASGRSDADAPCRWQLSAGSCSQTFQIHRVIVRVIVRKVFVRAVDNVGPAAQLFAPRFP